MSLKDLLQEIDQENNERWLLIHERMSPLIAELEGAGFVRTRADFYGEEKRYTIDNRNRITVYYNATQLLDVGISEDKRETSHVYYVNHCSNKVSLNQLIKRLVSEYKKVTTGHHED